MIYGTMLGMKLDVGRAMHASPLQTIVKILSIITKTVGLKHASTVIQKPINSLSPIGLKLHTF